MKILHLLSNGVDELSSRIIEAHAREHEVTVIDLSSLKVPYDVIVDEIFAQDKVISW